MSAPASKPEAKSGHTFRRFKDGDHEWGSFAGADLHRRRNRQVPDLRAQDAALPGELPVGRRHPRLAQHRARRGEAAQGHEHAGVRVPPLDRRQSVSLDDGAGVPGALPDRLQSQRGGRLRRHQRGRAVHRRLRAGAELRVPGRARYRQARRDRGRRPGGPRRRPINCAAKGMPSPCSTITPSWAAWRSTACRATACRASTWTARSTASSRWASRSGSTRASATTFTLKDLEADFDAVLLAIGCKAGRSLPVPGADAPNCISGVAFLEAFNQGRLQVGRRPRGGGRRRRHLGRRGLGGAAAGLRQGHEGDRAPGVRGDGPHRARRLGAWRRARAPT